MARITIWLFIESPDLTVEEMTRRVGLPPDKSRRVGDPRGKTGKRFETNSWTLESQLEIEEENPLIIGDKMQSCLTNMLERIAAHEHQFSTLAVGRTAGVFIGITANEIPPLELKSDTLKALARLGVDVEIDLMV